MEPVKNGENRVSGREDGTCKGPWIFLGVRCLRETPGWCGQRGKDGGSFAWTESRGAIKGTQI